MKALILATVILVGGFGVYLMLPKSSGGNLYTQESGGIYYDDAKVKDDSSFGPKNQQSGGTIYDTATPRDGSFDTAVK